MRATITTILLLTTTLLSSCNTMKGLGQDIQGGGKNLENSAKRNK